MSVADTRGVEGDSVQWKERIKNLHIGDVKSTHVVRSIAVEMQHGMTSNGDFWHLNVFCIIESYQATGT